MNAEVTTQTAYTERLWETGKLSWQAPIGIQTIAHIEPQGEKFDLHFTSGRCASVKPDFSLCYQAREGSCDV